MVLYLGSEQLSMGALELDSSILDQQSGIQTCCFQPTVSSVPLGATCSPR